MNFNVICHNLIIKTKIFGNLPMNFILFVLNIILTYMLCTLTMIFDVICKKYDHLDQMLRQFTIEF